MIETVVKKHNNNYLLSRPLNFCAKFVYVHAVRLRLYRYPYCYNITEHATCFRLSQWNPAVMCVCAVSYTHLDVYKRQVLDKSLNS